MGLKLSYSQVNTYTTCGQKYNLHYNKRLRSNLFHSALAFGSAIDNGLNELLLNLQPDKAKDVFDKSWSFQYVNDVYTNLCDSPDLIYAESDFDKDLLMKEDWDKLFLDSSPIEPLVELEKIQDRKSSVGFNGLTLQEKRFYNYSNWLCMRRKGHIMIDSYDKKIMPRIRKTIEVQYKTSLESDEGDSVVQVLDAILEWEDGRNILFDNKTSAREYAPDSPSTSQQLISYYYQSKEKFNLSAVGFFVLRKQILKNKTKKCSKCSFDGSGGRHKTCSNEINKVRCNGEWIETISPECLIEIHINEVPEAAQELVLSTFSEAAHGIKQGLYYKNLNACQMGSITCPFKEYCWTGKKDSLVELKNKDK